jgi:hypothetical protein
MGLPDCPDPATGESIHQNCDASSQPNSPTVEDAQPGPANGSGLAGSAGAAGGNMLVLVVGSVLVAGAGLYLANRKK